MEVERNDLCHDSQWSEQVTGDRLLSVNADLEIDIGGHRMFVRGVGSHIVLELPSVAMAVRLVRDLGSLRSARTRLAAISSSLTMVGLTVIVRTPRRRLMTIGQDGNSWLLRLFGFPNAQLHAF